jgi:hypothetical protein
VTCWPNALAIAATDVDHDDLLGLGQGAATALAICGRTSMTLSRDGGR